LEHKLPKPVGHRKGSLKEEGYSHECPYQRIKALE
jgi:hypothetical protein